MLRVLICFQWPEGYLSYKKDTLVANARLSRAAMDNGLDKYILTRAFTGKKHSYMVEDLLEGHVDNATRELSSKIPADVVESLIGAAMMDGGFVKALACISIFLPELDWPNLAIRRASLYKRAPVLPLSVVLQPMEDLLGYTFTKPGLLQEAVTHASCNTGSASYERLEFLGDALLDHIVVTTMRSESRKDLTHMQLHTLRTALVNADFLAFLSMETSTCQQIGKVVQRHKRSRRNPDSSDTASSPFESVDSTVSLPLWCFMRQQSPRLTTDQHKTVSRHAELASQIRQALQCGPRYPWADLARLKAEKFFSDMIESILGAVWIDSGCLETCRALLERLGLLPCLRRLLHEDVEILHPKEAVGQLADTQTVTYIISWDDSEAQVPVDTTPAPVPGARKLLTCRLLVGDEEIVCVRGGWSKLEVQTRAAEMATLVLRERQRNEQNQ